MLNNQMVIEEPNLFFFHEIYGCLTFQGTCWRNYVMAHFQYFLVRLHVFLAAISSKKWLWKLWKLIAAAWNPSGSVWRWGSRPGSLRFQRHCHHHPSSSSSSSSWWVVSVFQSSSINHLQFQFMGSIFQWFIIIRLEYHNLVAGFHAQGKASGTPGGLWRRQRWWIKHDSGDLPSGYD